MNLAQTETERSAVRHASCSHGSRQRGFSLIEVMTVLLCIGILSAISIPMLVKARADARRSGALANLRQIIQGEHGYHLEKRRFARLDELNTFCSTQLGEQIGATLRKTNYTFQMIPSAPTDAELATTFTVSATEVQADGTLVQFIGDQGGGITQTYP
ncbi:MAG TPA: prepilin-type N-terminal cleavage/methylation domain-containing protein [Blastocatellia bacterium]|nr:prepilin-type N-terminal cleavage/methylation domain-containing protein [Blastocatellia bacterium]